MTESEFLGSLAALWQSAIGNVVAGSLFAFLQSITMSAGALLIPFIIAAGAIVTAVVVMILDPALRAKVIDMITTAAKAVYEHIGLHDLVLGAASIAASVVNMLKAIANAIGAGLGLHDLVLGAASIAASVVNMLKAIAKAISAGVGVGSLGAASLGATSFGASVVNMTTTAASAVSSGVGAATGGFRANVAPDI
jgi:hypothetical protein